MLLPGFVVMDAVPFGMPTASVLGSCGVTAHCGCFRQICVVTFAVLVRARSYFFRQSPQAALGSGQPPLGFTRLAPATLGFRSTSPNLPQQLVVPSPPLPAQDLPQPLFGSRSACPPHALPSRLVPPRQMHTSLTRYTPVGIGFHDLAPARLLPTLLGSQSPPPMVPLRALWMRFWNKNGEAWARAEHTCCFRVNVLVFRALPRSASQPRERRGAFIADGGSSTVSQFWALCDLLGPCWGRVRCVLAVFVCGCFAWTPRLLTHLAQTSVTDSGVPATL